jgi:hypothetical protein
MRANAISRPRTQPDPPRNFSQVRAPRSTQSDGDGLPKQAWTSLTRKRSLVQIQYGPPGISCSWPYKVALCGPTTALQRALPGLRYRDQVALKFLLKNSPVDLACQWNAGA